VILRSKLGNNSRGNKDVEAFVVRRVSAVEMEDLNTFAVVLSDNLDGSGDVFELQKALSFGEQDIALGQATYCLSLPSGETHYGGVVAFALEPSSFTLDLTPVAGEIFGDERLVFPLELEEKEKQTLKSGLERIFSGIPNPPRAYFR
jgi:hypothetical protein